MLTDKLHRAIRDHFDLDLAIQDLISAANTDLLDLSPGVRRRGPRSGPPLVRDRGVRRRRARHR